MRELWHERLRIWFCVHFLRHRFYLEKWEFRGRECRTCRVCRRVIIQPARNVHE